jgi:signal transduction histidine kinase
MPGPVESNAGTRKTVWIQERFRTVKRIDISHYFCILSCRFGATLRSPLILHVSPASSGAPAERETFPGRASRGCVRAEHIMADGDLALLRVLLENLLNNAWKFTSKRPITRIEFGSMRQADGTVANFVRDNGAGFNMKYADKLFGPFQRFHKPEDFPGTGIGLASVQRIVQRHRGQIWAQSTVGEGSTFYFSLDGVAGANHPVTSHDLRFVV